MPVLVFLQLHACAIRAVELNIFYSWESSGQLRAELWYQVDHVKHLGATGDMSGFFFAP